MTYSDEITKIAEQIKSAKLWGKINSDNLKKELKIGIKKMFDLQGQGAIDTMDIIRNRTLEAIRIGIKWHNKKIEEYKNDVQNDEYGDSQKKIIKKLLNEFIDNRNKLVNIDNELDTRNLTFQKAEKAINTFIKMLMNLCGSH